MEKQGRTHRNPSLDKIGYIDVQIQELEKNIGKRLRDIERQLDKLNIKEDRLCSLERQLEGLAKKIQKDQVFRDDYSSASARRQRDKTVYLFENNTIRKKYLVLECMKRYITENHISCFAALVKRFPPTLRQTYGVIQQMEKVKERGWERSFHMDDVLHLEDGDCVVCSEWDISNLSPILDIFTNELHYDIIPYENGIRKDDTL